jgi:hypothetical protein
MLKLIDWIYKDYIFSAPAFHFLPIYFSSQRISKMLKSNNIDGIKNATWDLCFLQQLITLTKKSENTYWLFSTFDKAIKATTKLVFRINVDESNSDYFKRLEASYMKMWGKKDKYGKELLEKYKNFPNSANDVDRNIVRFNDSKAYIAEIGAEVDKEFQNYVLKVE